MIGKVRLSDLGCMQVSETYQMFHFYISFCSLSPPFMRSADTPMAIIFHFAFVTANFGKIMFLLLSEAGLEAKEAKVVMTMPSLLRTTSVVICWDATQVIKKKAYFPLSKINRSLQ